LYFKLRIKRYSFSKIHTFSAFVSKKREGMNFSHPGRVCQSCCQRVREVLTGRWRCGEQRWLTAAAHLSVRGKKHRSKIKLEPGFDLKTSREMSKEQTSGVTSRSCQTWDARLHEPDWPGSRSGQRCCNQAD
jgi:hypothetical protein